MADQQETATTDLLAELAEAREHCDEMGVFACVDRLIALRSTSAEAQQNIEDWLVSAYLPRDDVNSFVAMLRDMPSCLLLAFLASHNQQDAQVRATRRCRWCRLPIQKARGGEWRSIASELRTCFDADAIPRAHEPESGSREEADRG